MRLRQIPSWVALELWILGLEKTGSNIEQNHIMKVRHQGDQAVAVVGSITHGIKGYSIDETLASFSHRAAILLDRIVEI